MKQILVTISTICSMVAFQSHADTYDPVTNRLTIDSVQVGDTIYANVVVTVGNVISIGSSRPASTTQTVSETCSTTNMTKEKFDAIRVGMSFSQVTQIIGCRYNPSRTIRAGSAITYIWDINPATFLYMQITFDPTGSVVQHFDPTDTSSYYKFSMGF